MVRATRLKYPSISRLTSSWGSLRRQTVVLSAAFLQLSDTDSLRSTQSRMAAADTDLDSGDFQHMSVLYIQCLSSTSYVCPLHHLSVLYILSLSPPAEGLAGGEGGQRTGLYHLRPAGTEKTSCCSPTQHNTLLVFFLLQGGNSLPYKIILLYIYMFLYSERNINPALTQLVFRVKV